MTLSFVSEMPHSIRLFHMLHLYDAENDRNAFREGCISLFVYQITENVNFLWTLLTIITFENIIYIEKGGDAMKLSDIITNPIRMKIMQFLQIRGEATTKQICEELSDVPQPTLYRHIDHLLKEEVLIVKSERKVRGTLERLLTLNESRFTENADIADSAYRFLMALYGSLLRYSEKGACAPVADMLCLRTCMLTLTDESYADLLQELRAVVDKYSRSEENGKNRSLSVISAPVTEEERE